MIKRLSLLLAAMFVVSMMFAVPVFASGNGDNNNGDEWSWCDDNGNHNGNSNHDECDDNGDHNGDNNGNGNGDVSVDVSAKPAPAPVSRSSLGRSVTERATKGG
jgi:hypothetical protein